jgi:hypothetical protein
MVFSFSVLSVTLWLGLHSFQIRISQFRLIGYLTEDSKPREELWNGSGRFRHWY